MGQAFDLLAEAGVINNELAINLRKAVGFRNIVVHNYDEVDWSIVFWLCTNAWATSKLSRARCPNKLAIEQVTAE